MKFGIVMPYRAETLLCFTRYQNINMFYDNKSVLNGIEHFISNEGRAT